MPAAPERSLPLSPIAAGRLPVLRATITTASAPARVNVTRSSVPEIVFSGTTPYLRNVRRSGMESAPNMPNSRCLPPGPEPCVTSRREPRPLRRYPARPG